MLQGLMFFLLKSLLKFKLLGKIVSQYLPPEYPYDVVGGARNIKQADFDDRIDVVPVADPNIFSMSATWNTVLTLFLRIWT